MESDIFIGSVEVVGVDLRMVVFIDEVEMWKQSLIEREGF